MTLSELAEAANLPVATVKYYLREGLLPPGTPVTRTRADYSAGHLDRLRLVRALVDAAGLSIADARRIVAVVALASRPPRSAMSPAARVRLNAITARTSHALFAVNTPEGR